MNYTPHDWYWIVGGDETHWYSSAARDYVAPGSAPAQAFLALGNEPTRILNEAELWDVLVAAGVPLPANQMHHVPVAAWRFHAMLAIQGLDGALEALLASMPQPDQAIARARLERSQTYDCFDPLTIQLATALGMTDADRKALWRQAHAL